jgi:S-DNA-T family DNA segregation ATPase FtsK/SpoIIIE
MLVSGATGAGKSVFINTAITALTRQNSPDSMRMVLIDPKQVELSHWENDPHMDESVIYNVSGAISKLNELTQIMDSRYTTLRKAGAKSIEKYSGNMPYILVVIDEFADLIMSKEKIRTNDEMGRSMDGELSGAEIENAVVRLAQKGRAAGIHMIIGTQKPIVKVLTGLIKANIPTRVAFMCTSQVDSRVILDTKGAEELLGAGDMLFQDPSTKGLQRLQGYYLE